MKTILSVLALALSASLVQATNPDETSFFADLGQSRRAWSLGPLSLDEFKGHPAKDTVAIWLDWHYNTVLTSQRVGRDKYNYYEFTPYLDMTESWIQPSLRNEHSLLLAQTSFDLLQLYGIRATSEFMRGNVDANTISRYVVNQYRRRFDDMVFDTQKGQDTARTHFYASAVALELEQTHFDPSSVPLGEPGLLSDLYVGLSTFTQQSDYFSGISCGLAFGMGLGYGRHLGILDMGLHGGARCEADIRNHNGWMLKGDDVSTGYMRLSYAYNLTPQSRRTLYAAAGLGVTFFDGPAFEDNDQKHRSNEVAGFSLHAGVIYDIPIRRQFSLMGQNSCVMHGVRIKPYVEFVDLARGIGWTPTFNLSIIYVLHSVIYR